MTTINVVEQHGRWGARFPNRQASPTSHAEALTVDPAIIITEHGEDFDHNGDICFSIHRSNFIWLDAEQVDTLIAKLNELRMRMRRPRS